MKIRAVANGNVIDAHPDAAKELIEAGIYEAVDETDPQNNFTAPDTVTDTAPKRRRKAR